MRRRSRSSDRNPSRSIVGALAALATVAAAVGCAAADTLPALRVSGAQLVTETGEPVNLRAANLGNWFLIEPWMFGIFDDSLRDHATFTSILEQRFGADEAERLMDLHREHWITEREFALLDDFGFNAVRIPLHYELHEDAGDNFKLREDAWEWTDRAIELARDAGVYVIFDMHAVPGGQSLDAPSGDATENNLWGNQTNIDRLAWLWQHFSRRYKNEPVFAGYDIINEPYGDFSTDYRPELITIADRVINAIREIDPDRPIFLPGSLQGIEFYGDPASRGWTGIGFTEHFYPGLFDGREPTLGEHARFLATDLVRRDRFLAGAPAPYLWGEMNPVFDRAGGPGMLRRFFDECETRGWAAAMWSLKLVKSQGGVQGDNWYLVTNAQPWSLGNIRSASKASIEADFEALGTMELAIDTEARDIIGAVSPSPLALPTIDPIPFDPPANDAVTGFTGYDIGQGTPAGGQRVSSGRIELFAGGGDVFGSSDAFRFMARSMPGDFFATTTLERFSAPRKFAKAGLMARASDAANAPHLFVHAFPDGRAVLAWRASQGGSTGQRVIATPGFPMGMALGRIGGQLVAMVTDADGAWESVPVPVSPSLGSSPLVGAAANANDVAALATATFDELGLTFFQTTPGGLTIDTAAGLLANAGFEDPENIVTQNRARSWVSDSGSFTRESGWVPRRDGNAVAAYRHWETGGSSPASIAQDAAGLVPGERYVFGVYVSLDAVSGGASNADRIELVVETADEPPLVLEQRSFSSGDLATGSDWSRIELPFRPTADTVRVRIRAYPAGGARDGAVKFDGAFLQNRP